MASAWGCVLAGPQVYCADLPARALMMRLRSRRACAEASAPAPIAAGFGHGESPRLSPRPTAGRARPARRPSRPCADCTSRFRRRRGLLDRVTCSRARGPHGRGDRELLRRGPPASPSPTWRWPLPARRRLLQRHRLRRAAMFGVPAHQVIRGLGLVPRRQADARLSQRRVQFHRSRVAGKLGVFSFAMVAWVSASSMADLRFNDLACSWRLRLRPRLLVRARPRSRRQ